MEINPDQSRMHIIQGVANEVLAASITIFLILSYLIYSTISFFKYMPQRSFNLSENFRNFFSQNNPIQNPLNYNQNQQPNVQNEFITQNNCSICLNHIQYEITTSCAHLFCAKCIIDYWNSIHKYKLSCPMCRSSITMLHFNFEESQVQNPQIKAIINEIYHYNFQYSNEPKSIWIKIRETPFYIKRIFSFLSTREGLRFFAFSAYNSVFFLGILIYILSPFDLIPEAIFGIFGFIDDLVALGFLIFVVGDLYYQYMIRRNMMHYHSNN